MSSEQESRTNCPRAACTKEGSTPAKLILERWEDLLTGASARTRTTLSSVFHADSLGPILSQALSGLEGPYGRQSPRSPWIQESTLPNLPQVPPCIAASTCYYSGNKVGAKPRGWGEVGRDGTHRVHVGAKPHARPMWNTMFLILFLIFPNPSLI